MSVDAELHAAPIAAAGLRVTQGSTKLAIAGALQHMLAARQDTPAQAPRAFAVFAHCFRCAKDTRGAAVLVAATSMPEAKASTAGSGRLLTALIVGQLGLHGAMAGLRLAAPLQALKEGYSAWAVGLLLALFAAAPVLLALHSGRLADRFGYHKPVYLAATLAGIGVSLAVASTFVRGEIGRAHV